MADKIYENNKLFMAIKIGAILIGIYGLTFRQISAFWKSPFEWNNHAVSARVHFITGPIVLILGIFQFQREFRRKNPQIHKWMGRIYIFCELLSVGFVFAMVLDSAFGLIPQISLFILNTLWGISLIIAVFQILVKRDIQQHRIWMIRNYALTCSAITLRIILLPLMPIIGQELAYKLATSNCFIWNILISEYAISRIQKDEKSISLNQNQMYESKAEPDDQGEGVIAVKSFN